MMQSNEPKRRKQYWWGLGLGLIPLVLNLVFFGLFQHSHSLSSPFLSLAILTLVLYGLELFFVIGFLVSKQTRFVGYGLLTAFLASPIIAVIGCNVIANTIH